MLLETVKVDCPYCGEPFETVIDCSLGEDRQEYIEDCYVCCRPIVFSVYITETRPYISVKDENSV